MRLSESMIVDKPKYIRASCGIMGSIVLLIAIYVFVNRVIFLYNAIPFDAPIVAVAHEYAPAGAGSVLAYVPTVQVRDGQGKALEVKVDTFNEAPVYTVGQQMQVSCNLERGCIEDTFHAKWGACLFEFVLSFLLFSPLLALRTGLWQPNDEITALHLQRDA